MRYLLKILIAIISMTAATGIAKAWQELPETIRDQTQKRIDLGYHLGTVIGVIDRNGARFFSFGQVSLSDTSAPDENTIFEIASITKTFTATLLADLQLEGRMGIHDPVADHIPLFRKPDELSGMTTTILDLVNHTAGLPRNPTNTIDADNNRYADYSVADLNEFLSSFSRVTGPGEHLYTNTGSVVLEHAIEKATGRDYEDLIRTRVLDVLGMDDSYFVVPAERKARLATGFRSGEETMEVDVGIWNAMGGLRTTAEDLLTYIGAQIGLTPTPLQRALELSQKEMFNDGETASALGWYIRKNKETGKTIYYHTGGTEGFVSFAGFSLQEQKGVVILVNGTRWFSDLGFHILDPAYPVRQVNE